MENILSKLKPRSLFFSIKQAESIKEAENKRTLFYTKEVYDLYANFEFYNKLFDEEDWEDLVKIKLFLNEGDQSHFIKNVPLYFTTSKFDNISMASVKLIDGENDKKLEPGEYFCPVYYEDTVIYYEFFNIEDAEYEELTPQSFVNVQTLKLFTGDSESEKSDDRRIYLSRFHGQATKYIWAELQVESLIKHEWKGEFIFRFYNDSKELMGQENKIIVITPENQSNENFILSGIGSDTEVTWEEDNYTVEITFLNQKIAVAFFEVGDTNSSLPSKTFFPLKETSASNPNSCTDGEEEIFNEIDQLIGLTGIKQKLHDHYAYVKYLMLRKENGLANLKDIKLNFVFTGNPGTGKTTVALLLGKIYKQLGLLAKDTVYEVDRSHLVGRYIGDTAPLTKEVIEKARGGILFIDEAYALWRDDEKDFGRESIEVLVKELSDGKGDIAFVVAGYPKEMKEFIESNTGLKSRFNFTFEFADYTPDELFEIAKLMVKQKSLIITEEALKVLYKIIVDEYRKRDKHFGNARFINSIIEEAQVNLGLRIVRSKNMNEISKVELSTIKDTDISRIVEAKEQIGIELPIDEKLLNVSLQRLNNLIGLKNVKTKIRELVKLARYYKESQKPLLNSISLHNVFIGNPGTGKTTVARILADIYKALGLLERGHLVECARESLVAGFIGQTAIKTKALVEESFGGVLFIDEAYSLTPGGGTNDFGGEAIEVILKTMEDNRGVFGVIAAGYTNEMIEFLDANPGLRSRFDNIIEFEDFSSADLMLISERMLNSEDLCMEEKAAKHLEEFFDFQNSNKDKFFGNARFVRKIVDQVIRNHHLRLSDMPIEKRGDEVIRLITYDDVDDFIPQKDFVSRKRKRIGF